MENIKENITQDFHDYSGTDSDDDIHDLCDLMETMSLNDNPRIPRKEDSSGNYGGNIYCNYS